MLVASSTILAGLYVSAAGPDVHRFEIADCDDVTFGPEGDIYLACHSPDDRLPIAVKGAKPAPDQMDAYVLRFNIRTKKLIYATRFRGPSFDAALRVKVDRAGFAYTTGLTKSHEFFVSPNALQPKFGGGGSDAFLVKIAPSGSVVYSTFIGGAGDDVGNAIELDQAGVVYVGGTTSSTGFPGKRNAGEGNVADVFVCRIEIARKANACRVFGGAKEEKLTGLALDNRGGVYAVGYTKSGDFATKDPVQPALAGQTDLFLARFVLPTLGMSFSSFFGGSGDDSGWGIAIDRNGDPVVAGTTDSVDLPVSAGAPQRVKRGKRDAFVATFRATHRKVLATYFGGSNDDESGYDGSDVQIDRNGDVWLAGVTISTDLPVRNASQKQFGGGNGDGFIARFSPDLTSLCFGSYYGGKERDILEGLAISSSGTVVSAGVSIDDMPSPSHIQLGQLPIHASAFTLVLPAQRGCRD